MGTGRDGRERREGGERSQAVQGLPEAGEALGAKSGNTLALKDEVRRTFRANMHETDPEKIHTMKEAAFRGLGNYIFVEAQKMAGTEDSEPTT
eukprot:CAMPEP_0198465608 /NCGR_PEP_ID=MMETSP1456-20131121/3472_1 /TAXON_ID=1461544 ORGANISM="Unidentified sp., Strain RCC1871" /NCGR_SAMPLE_ID=MMETSP1456 /ASSEMBLY_ACC=CAM_ASM_001119 /LENGTH=92 /DNA_ID=CAMNT_0044191479 /DNA_START=17 /DNA_END=296 /DNA_ORIENTATION=+